MSSSSQKLIEAWWLNRESETHELSTRAQEAAVVRDEFYHPLSWQRASHRDRSFPGVCRSPTARLTNPVRSELAGRLRAGCRHSCEARTPAQTWRTQSNEQA